jgi:hypothetical protein
MPTTQPVIASPATTAKDSKDAESAFRRRSLLRVRRPAWSPQAKPPAER